LKYTILITILLELGFGQDKGKNAFADERYDEARSYYEEILLKRKNDNAAKFGLGTTAYKQKDIETALRFLSDAKNSEDLKLASKAYYNLGNMLREQNKMDESLSLYKKAMELDSDDQDAKINYELLKQVMQQNKENQQDQNQQDQNQQDQNQQDQNQQDQNQQDQNQQDQNQQDQNQQDQKQQDQNQQDQSQKDQSQKDQDQQTQDKKNNRDDKTDEQIQAEAILNALKDQEKINQKRQIKKASSRKMEKDW